MTVAAMLLGNSCAARYTRMKNAPTLRVPRIAERHHQEPFGSDLATASRIRPAGMARMSAPYSG